MELHPNHGPIAEKPLEVELLILKAEEVQKSADKKTGSVMHCRAGRKESRVPAVNKSKLQRPPTPSLSCELINEPLSSTDHQSCLQLLGCMFAFEGKPDCVYSKGCMQCCIAQLHARPPHSRNSMVGPVHGLLRNPLYALEPQLLRYALLQARRVARVYCQELAGTLDIVFECPATLCVAHPQ